MGLRKPALAKRTPPPLQCGKMRYRQYAAYRFGSLGFLLLEPPCRNNHAFNGQPCFTSVFLGVFIPSLADKFSLLAFQIFKETKSCSQVSPHINPLLKLETGYPKPREALDTVRTHLPRFLAQFFSCLGTLFLDTSLILV